MLEHKLQHPTSLLMKFFNLFAGIKPHPIAARAKKAKPVEDDGFYENASKSVLIEYYKNLGRGPI